MESNQGGRQMGVPPKVTRAEHLPQELRQMASDMKAAAQARRAQTISFILDGWTRGYGMHTICLCNRQLPDSLWLSCCGASWNNRVESLVILGIPIVRRWAAY